MDNVLAWTVVDALAGAREKSARDREPISLLVTKLDGVARVAQMFVPVEAIVRRALSRLSIWNARESMGDQLICARWDNAWRAELALFTLDPVEYLGSGCEEFVQRCAEVFAIKPVDVRQFVHLVSTETPAVRDDVRARLEGESGAEGGQGAAEPCIRRFRDGDRSHLGLAAPSHHGNRLEGRLDAWARGRDRNTGGLEGDPAAVKAGLRRLAVCSRRKTAATELRDKLSRSIDQKIGSSLLADSAESRQRFWPGLREYDEVRDLPGLGQPMVRNWVKALLALDVRLTSWVTASAAALEYRQLELLKEVTSGGLILHGTTGRGAALAINRAMGARLSGDWPEARWCYIRAAQSRVAHYRRIGLVAGMFGAFDSGDHESVLRFADLAILENQRAMEELIWGAHDSRRLRAREEAASADSEELRSFLEREDRRVWQWFGRTE